MVDAHPRLTGEPCSWTGSAVSDRAVAPERLPWRMLLPADPSAGPV